MRIRILALLLLAGCLPLAGQQHSPLSPPPPPSPVLGVEKTVPDGFHWVDIESEMPVMAKVRAALLGRKVRAYREVGVEDGYALVFASERKEEASSPSDDFWSAYSVALETGKADLLLSGYNVSFHPWIGREIGELPITYDECVDCEGISLFTTFRLMPKVGWRARWSPKLESGQPVSGIRRDCGEATGGVDISSPVFAVFNREQNGYQVGFWCRVSEVIFDHLEGNQVVYKTDPATGKAALAITDDVMRYWVDPATGEDKEEKLTGAAARDWERNLCMVRDGLSLGQDSELCRALHESAASQTVP